MVVRVMIVMATAEKVDGDMTKGKRLVQQTVERQDAAADDKHRRESERDRGSGNPGRCDDRPLHGRFALLQFLLPAFTRALYRRLLPLVVADRPDQWGSGLSA